MSEYMMLSLLDVDAWIQANCPKTHTDSDGTYHLDWIWSMPKHAGRLGSPQLFVAANSGKEAIQSDAYGNSSQWLLDLQRKMNIAYQDALHIAYLKAEHKQP